MRAPSRTYDVVVGAGWLPRADAFLPPLPRAERAFVVADGAVADRFLPILAVGLATRGLRVERLPVPPGEAAKTLAVAEGLLRGLAAREAHRDDPVVALGGGSTGDVAGFVAATYMRGVPFVQVPTTLLAQVDAAIGGKTAVNLPEGKNLVGAFHQPVAVLADVETLASLSDADLRSGLAEVVKVALTLDPALLEVLGADASRAFARDAAVLETLVARAARAKAEVVAVDERDADARMVLNYGHTLGHALERLGGFRGRSHGEAVAVGMRFAARLAVVLDIADADVVEAHDGLLARLGLGDAAGLPDVEEVLAALRLDKKYAGGVRFVLLEAIGRARVVEGVGEDAIRAAYAAVAA
ncbi:MAG: 3-dehydroquinate synthase [Actinomycetota bacterium]